jgi:predicted aldo/keto reductase-like oxidoreductase
MLYRPYGQTGLSVSAIGFGGMRFPDQNDVEACAALVKAAYDVGINYFDTSIGYGKSEELFGAAFKDMLKTRGEKPFYVSTKSSAGEPDAIRRDLETSLGRMGLDAVDFYHVWCVITPDEYGKRKAAGALEAFARLKQEGLVGHVCLSTHMAGADIGPVLEDFPFEGVLLGYSAMNFPYREEGIAAAARLKRGVVVMNPLGGGIIPQHADRFGFVRTRPDETVVEGALRFLLDDVRITVALVGFSTTDQIREAVSAVDGYRPIAAAERQRIRAGLRQAFNEMCTGCGYCDHCPEGIPVPRYMDAYNQYLLSGDPGTIPQRLDFHWDIDKDDLQRCTLCGRCEEACTQKLPIRERLEFIRKKG